MGAKLFVHGFKPCGGVNGVTMHRVVFASAAADVLPDGALERAEVFVIGSDTTDDFAYRFPDAWCDAVMVCPDPAF